MSNSRLMLALSNAWPIVGAAEMVAAKAVLSFLFPWPQVWNYVRSWNYGLSIYHRMARGEAEQA